MKALSIIKYLFTFLGLAMLIGSFYINEDTRSFIAQATKTEGTVVCIFRPTSNKKSAKPRTLIPEKVEQ